VPVSFRDYSVERRLDTLGVPGLLGAPGRILQIHQRWDMFSHTGPPIRGWPGVVVTARDGRVLSLLEDGRELVINPEGARTSGSAGAERTLGGLFYIPQTNGDTPAERGVRRCGRTDMGSRPSGDPDQRAALGFCS
jgi:hypothetical protein